TSSMSLRLRSHHAERAVGPRACLAVGGDHALGEAKRAAKLDDVAFEGQPLSYFRRPDEIDGKADRDQPAIAAVPSSAATQPHRVVGERGDEAAMGEAARVGVRLGQPYPEDNGVGGPLV